MKVKVKFIRPVYPYKSWDVAYIDEKKAKYFKNQVEIVQEEKEVKPGEEVKPVKKRKQVKKKSNKAVLNNNNTKWL